MTTKEETRVLIEANLNLVNHVVFQVAVHFPRHVDRQDLARAGALGLVEAAQRYDDARGVPFERFAAQRIRGAILDSVRSADWAPRSVRSMARRFDQMEQRLASELGRVPERDEVAKALGMTREEIHRLRDQTFRSVVLALESLVTDSSEEHVTLMDVLEDPKAVEPARELEGREMPAFLRAAARLLPARQRLVIVGYFPEDPVDTFRRHVWINPFWEDDVHEVVDLMGADRVLFGSDLPFIDCRPMLGYIGFSRVSDESKRRILGLNAARLFGLGAG